MSSTQRRPLVAGNWKMNGLKHSAAELDAIVRGCGDLWHKVDLLICPPATLIMPFAVVALGPKVRIGAQDCHAQASGAHTGDLSAEMLAESGASAVILGHSERRTEHHETDAEVRAKTLGAWRAGLMAIVCIGESRAQRDRGETLAVLETQLAGSLPDGVSAPTLVIAYEPVWAIGTGLTPTTEDVAQAHRFIRERLGERFGPVANGIRILYGGSVKPSNAKELLAVEDVDGALVGGASLKSDDFLGIAHAYA